MTEVLASLYSDFIEFITRSGILNFSNVFHRYSWSILSYAFSWSKATIIPFLLVASARYLIIFIVIVWSSICLPGMKPAWFGCIRLLINFVILLDSDFVISL